MALTEASPLVAAPVVRSAALAHAGRAAVVTASVLAVALLAEHESRVDEALTAVVLSAVWLLSLEAAFATSRATLAALGTGVALVRGAIFGLVLTAAVGVWLPTVEIGELSTLALATVVVVVAAAWELGAQQVVSPQRIVLVGPSEACISLIREFRRSGSRRFTVAGVVHDTTEEGDGSLLLGRTDELARVIAETRPDLVALAPGCNRPEAFAQILDSASSGFKVLELAQLYEHAFGRVPVRDLTRAWFMGVLHLYRRPYTLFAKRVLDVVGTTFVIVLVIPLLPLLALAMLVHGRPVLLRQTRVGEHGEPFTMYKLRTMRVDAEPDGRAVWSSQDDPRVTVLGRVLRRFRFDELPQLWNILRGDMSLVGPRPERPEFIDELLAGVPHWERRHLVKPGITGWAQVNRGYAADTEGSLDKLSYDLWYIRHRSLTVDLAICARTLGAVLRGEWTGREQLAPRFEPLFLLGTPVPDAEQP